MLSQLKLSRPGRSEDLAIPAAIWRRFSSACLQRRWRPWARVQAPAVLALAALSLLAPSCSRDSAGGQFGAAVECIIGSQGKSAGKFFSPRSLAARAGAEEICVVDKSGRIQRWVPAGGPAGALESGWRVANWWMVPEYQIGQPTGLAYDREGRLLVADTHYQRILVYDAASGALVRSWGTKGSGDGQFTQVRDVIQDGSGAYFASDYDGPADRIEKFDGNGRFLLAFGKRGNGPGEFNRPQGLALSVRREPGGLQETLLVADSCNHRIQRFSLDGKFLGQWGGEGTGPGQFAYPYAVAAEPSEPGRIVVVEWQNNRIQCFDRDGRYLSTWGGPGRGPGQFYTPWDVAIDSSSRVFVVDFGNHRVQVIRLQQAAGGVGGKPL